MRPSSAWYITLCDVWESEKPKATFESLAEVASQNSITAGSPSVPPNATAATAAVTSTGSVSSPAPSPNRRSTRLVSTTVVNSATAPVTERKRPMNAVRLSASGYCAPAWA